MVFCCAPRAPQIGQELDLEWLSKVVSLWHTSGTLMLLIILWPCQVRGDHEAILASAFAAFDENYLESWAFTEERTLSGVTSVGRYDPRESDQWQLLVIDGRKPSAKESEEYQEGKASGGNGASQRADSMVTPDSLSLKEETARYWLFDFLPMGEGGSAKVMKHLDGTIRISKSGPAVEFIDVRSAKSFRPRFGVRIREFLTHLEFTRAEDDGPVVPRQLQFRINMRAYGVISVDERVSIEYRDYQYVGHRSP